MHCSHSDKPPNSLQLKPVFWIADFHVSAYVIFSFGFLIITSNLIHQKLEVFSFNAPHLSFLVLSNNSCSGLENCPIPYIFLWKSVHSVFTTSACYDHFSPHLWPLSHLICHICSLGCRDIFTRLFCFYVYLLPVYFQH
jgi:hypothetical protein